MKWLDGDFRCGETTKTAPLINENVTALREQKNNEVVPHCCQYAVSSIE